MDQKLREFATYSKQYSQKSVNLFRAVETLRTELNKKYMIPRSLLENKEKDKLERKRLVLEKLFMEDVPVDIFDRIFALLESHDSLVRQGEENYREYQRRFNDISEEFFHYRVEKEIDFLSLNQEKKDCSG